MIDWITKYWIEVLFTLICSGAAFIVRHHVKLIIGDKKRRQDDMLKTIDNKFNEQRVGMEEQMSQCYNKLIMVVKDLEERSNAEDKKLYEKINSLTSGVLSIEGRAFKEDCRHLLEPNHVITLDEYEAIQAEHIIYNDLGGNHEGDGLFLMVQVKYQNNLQTNLDD